MRSAKTVLKSAAFATALMAGAVVSLGGAQAATFLSEDFNDTGFRGTPFSGLPVDQNNDKYANPTIDFYQAADHNGWTFSGQNPNGVGSTFINVHNTDGVDGAVLLNENGPGTATKTLAGLAPNTPYFLNFLYYGDNRPPGPTPSGGANSGIWGLHVDVNGATLDLSDTDKQPGSNPGKIATLLFFSDSAGAAILSFAQTTPGGSEASPIIDDVVVSNTPLPAALPLFISGLGGLGFFSWRRKKRKTAAAPVA